MTILGLGGLLNDAACAVLRDGELVSAVEQEKLSRRVEPDSLPEEAIRSALQIAGTDASQVDLVAVARPISETANADRYLAIRAAFPASRVVMVEHHLAHAASAYYASPFDEATVLTLDRAGDFRCGARWHAEDGRLTLDRELYYPDSLGDLYSRVTELLGFTSGADEHKVQWMSATGDDRFVPLFDEILAGDWPAPQRQFFDRDRLGEGGFSPLFYARLGVDEESAIPASLAPHVAAGLQRAIEKAVVRMAGPATNLCLAGGLAFNALLIRALEQRFTVFVQPAAGNAGTALGAAYIASLEQAGHATRHPLHTLCLGPSFTPEEIKQTLENCKLRFRFLLTTDELIDSAVKQLEEQRIVAWMQGRMEFGPRALGNRSLLASPLDRYATENLNAFVKHREPFRKFAAAVPAERAAEFFEAGSNARFLATVALVNEGHRDTFREAILGSGLIRVHAVSRDDNPLFHRLLTAWGERTGLPVLYNTSFNLFGDPLVCTPRDAVRSFYSSGVDALFVGNFLLEK